MKSRCVLPLLLAVVVAVEGATVVSWDSCPVERDTAASVLVAVDPLWMPGSPVHTAAVDGVRGLAAAGASFIRFLNFNIFPGLSCAALKEGEPYNFTAMDAALVPFMEAAGDAKVIIDIETSPDWMWADNYANYYAESTTLTPGVRTRCPYYGDPTTPRDASWKEIATYFKHVGDWYTKGGFTDEQGRVYSSGHHYDISRWEILNEVNHPREHDFSAADYTAMYDMQVKVFGDDAPAEGFMGPSLGGLSPASIASFLVPFMNASTHDPPSTPVTGVSFHSYAGCVNTSAAGMEAVFPSTDSKQDSLVLVDQAAKELRPEGIELHLTESGIFCNQPHGCDVNNYTCWYRTFPPSYWAASASQWVYQFLTWSKASPLASIAQSQILGYPFQYDGLSGEWPCGTMVDWNANALNAKYWVELALLDHVSRPFKFCDTTTSDTPSADVYVQGLSSAKGDVVVLINKRMVANTVTLTGATGKQAAIVDATSNNGPARNTTLTSDDISLPAFATVFVSW